MQNLNPTEVKVMEKFQLNFVDDEDVKVNRNKLLLAIDIVRDHVRYMGEPVAGSERLKVRPNKAGFEIVIVSDVRLVTEAQQLKYERTVSAVRAALRAKHSTSRL